MKLLPSLWLGMLLAATLHAAPVDLGQNLYYAGAAELAEPILATLPAVIIDLRDVDSPEKVLPLLNARSGKPTYVLLGTHLGIPAQRDLLTFGPAKTKPDLEVAAPDKAVAAELAKLRAAGLTRETINSLIIQNADKPRYDEATLVREHQLANTDPSREPIEDKETPAKPEPAATASAKTKPVIDPLLQRAVLVHRGLVALKKN